MKTTSYLKGKTSVILCIFLITLVLVTVISGLPNKTLADSKDDTNATKRTLNVTGQGKVEASPDIAYITLGVVTEHKDAGTAQDDNRQKMSSIILAIKSLGVKDDDIKTTNYSIYPRYNYIKETGERHIIGYTVNNSVQVTIRDISKVGKIIDMASKNGVNTSGGITFGLSDYEKYYNEALRNAVETAKRKAETMAGALGITLGVPVSVSESGGYHPPVYYDHHMKVGMGEAASTPIQAGTLRVTANVSMTYEY